MFPANSSHIRSLPSTAPKFLRHLFEHRGCRVIKNNETKWSGIPDNTGLFIKLRPDDESPFHATNYPLICNTLSFPRYLSAKQGKNATAIFKVSDADTRAHMKLVVDNVCKLHGFSRSCFSVTDASTKDASDKNVVDFICQETKQFSVRLLGDHVKYSVEGGGRLSHVLDHFVSILDWEAAFKQHHSSIMLRLGQSQDAASFKILEHVHDRGIVKHPVIVEVPKFDAKVKNSLNDFHSNSAFETYQYCISIADSAVPTALNHLTTYSCETVEEIVQTHERSPSEYYGQKKIAENILSIHYINGAETMEDCEVASKHLFRQFIHRDSIQDDLDKIERVVHSFPIVYTKHLPFAELCKCASEGLPQVVQPHFDEFVKKALNNGRLMCNGKRIALDHTFTNEDMLEERSILTLDRKKNKVVFMVIWKVPG